MFEMSEIKGAQFELPFIQNLDGKSPLHICIDNGEDKTADYMLRQLFNTPIDHHGRALIDYIPVAI
jgi:ankyrin repeat protein